MKAKIENGKLTIDLIELADGLSLAERTDLARHIVARKELFAAVLECVASPRAVGEYFTDDPDGEWWFDASALLMLREKLLPLLPAIARGAVEEALRQRNRAVADDTRHTRWAWQLYHAWPREHLDSRPDTIPDEPVRVVEPGEVDALVGKAGR